MKNSIIHLLFLTMITTWFISTTAYDWRDDVVSQAVIRSTCAKTHLYYFCVDAVNSFPVKYRYKTPFDVSQTLIQLLGWHVNQMILDTNRRVRNVTKYRKGSFTDNLQKCIDLYNKIYTIDYYSAADNLNAGKYRESEQRLMMGYKRAEECEAGFRRLGKLPFMFLKMNSKTCQLALVAAGATHTMIR